MSSSFHSEIKSCLTTNTERISWHR